MTRTEPATMGHLLQASARSHGPAEALVFPDERMTYTQLNDAARAWAKAFIALGVMPGDHVGIFLPTRLEFVAVFFGVTMIGAVAVPINARYQATELQHVLSDGDLVLLVTAGQVSDSLDFAGRLAEAMPSESRTSVKPRPAFEEAPLLRAVICVDVPTRDFLVGAGTALAGGSAVTDADLDVRIDAVADDDTMMMIYTSGTTAQPKGALIGHAAQIVNSRGLGQRYGVSASDRLWSPLPIFHTGGISTMTMMLGAGGAYLTAPQFDAGAALGLLGDERATIAYPSFVTIMQDLIEHGRFAETDLSALRIMNSNFAVQPDWIRDAVRKAIPGTTQVGTYGLTECCGTVSTSRPSDSYQQRTGRCGVALDHWQLKIVDLESGRDCEAGERGEIAVRGPSLFKGYYKADAKTAEAIRDGWFFTGDVGSLDAAGDVMFHGRTKDMLKVGGENVAAAEIETLLQTHPAVKLAQVVGVPDARYAEVPAAFVEMVEGHSASEAELIAHCRGKVANFKVPRHVRKVDSWPMSTSKIQKYRLRDRLIEELLIETDDR